MNTVIQVKEIISQIYFIRGKKVMIDSDLAMLYDVEVRILNQTVKRNIERFPEDFMFQLTETEFENLRSQIVILKEDDISSHNQSLEYNSQSLRSQNVILKDERGKHRKYLPNAFTEQGVAMLSGILRSERAIKINIAIMRAFVKMRELIDENKDLKKKLDELETKYDKQFKIVFEALRQLIQPPAKEKPSIGYKTNEEEMEYKKLKDKNNCLFI